MSLLYGFLSYKLRLRWQKMLRFLSERQCVDKKGVWGQNRKLAILKKVLRQKQSKESS